MVTMNIPKSFSYLVFAVGIYVAISIFFLFNLMTTTGDVAQADWAIPLTPIAAMNNLDSVLHVWALNGFGGSIHGAFGIPFLPLVNAALSPFGFVGGFEIKLLSVFLIALGGTTTYLLARSFGLGFHSSFLAGLFFMTTAVVFNWLMFGWLYYIFGYDLLPLMILSIKKFLDGNGFKYVLCGGLILSIACSQPAFILVYPPLAFIFVLLESKFNIKKILAGLLLIAVSIGIWLLTAISFFVSLNNTETLSFFQGSYFNAIVAQFNHLSLIINPVRLWGSTFNFQFETYFPQQFVILSFMPLLVGLLALLLRPRDRRVIFAAIAYLFTFVAYEAYKNITFLVYSTPYGGIWEAPSVFLVPASLGLSLLIGYTSQALFTIPVRQRKIKHCRIIKMLTFTFVLIILICGSIPWWTQQASGDPLPGIPTKLNLYKIPEGYTNWTNVVNAQDEYFVLYVDIGNALITNSSYFSQPYSGVSASIYTLTNNIPIVSEANTSRLLNDLFSKDSNISSKWGSYSIKYIVIYTNVKSAYNIPELVDILSNQTGIVKSASLPDVLVFENEYAKPIVYSDRASTVITYHDPTTYKIAANSSSPYTLTLNQAFSSGWVASIDGAKITNHSQNKAGFNSWYIENIGNADIEIYYEPQTIYDLSLAFSMIVFVLMVVLIIILTLRPRFQKITNLSRLM